MRIFCNINRLICLACSCTALSAGFSPSFAQNMNLPGSADPSRALEDLRLPVQPDRSLQAGQQPKKAVAIVPQGMEELRFTLNDIAVEGMTAYTPAEITPIFAPYLNTEISVEILFKIMGQLQQKYLDDGYGLTKVVIPNQDIQGGNVRLAVIEGHVQEITFGEGVVKSPAVLDAAAKIHRMRPLNIKTLERIMLLLNDLPDANISAILATPEKIQGDASGAVRIILQANPNKEKTGQIGFDNHGSVFTGPMQANASIRTTGLGLHHSALQLTTFAAIPLQEQKIGSVSYSLPLFGISGTKLALSASKARTEPGSSLSLLDIKGASDSFEANISYPVIRQRDMTLKADAGFEWKDSRTKILGEELYDDRLRIAKAGINFNFTDTMAGYNVVDVHYAQGLNAMGVRKAGSVDLSRQDGRPDFKKYEMLAARLQALPWNFELLGLVKGQYSRDPLLSSEEFGFGGAQIGRGYDSSEITGDHGISSTIELRYKTTLPVFNTVLALQPYAFYDIGKVWNIDRGAKNKISAASAGMGLRLNLDSGWEADFNLAAPLTRSADNEPKYQNDLGARALFSITKSF